MWKIGTKIMPVITGTLGTGTIKKGFYLLSNSPASEVYMPTFRNTLFHLHRQVGVKND
jgi:hypothetical protein